MPGGSWGSSGSASTAAVSPSRTEPVRATTADWYARQASASWKRICSISSNGLLAAQLVDAHADPWRPAARAPERRLAQERPADRLVLAADVVAEAERDRQPA